MSDKQFLTISLFLLFIDDVVVCCIHMYPCTSSTQIIGFIVNRFSSCKSCWFLTRSQLLRANDTKWTSLPSVKYNYNWHILSLLKIPIQVKRILFSYYKIIYDYIIYHNIFIPSLWVLFYAFFSLVFFLYASINDLFKLFLFFVLNMYYYTPKATSIWWSINKLFLNDWRVL